MSIEKAKRVAANLLSSKMYTCKEIYQKLLQKGFDDEISEQVVATFVAADILNDEEYAVMYIHDGVNVHLKGLYRIKQELMRKGVASSVIERALLKADVDTENGLMEYARLKFYGKVFTDRREIEKAKAHLIRRGYGISEINECFRELDIKVDRGDFD